MVCSNGLIKKTQTTSLSFQQRSRLQQRWRKLSSLSELLISGSVFQTFDDDQKSNTDKPDFSKNPYIPDLAETTNLAMWDKMEIHLF